MGDSYRLMYFDGRGRGEIARVLLTVAGKKFKDDRIDFKDWPAMKGKTPQGTMPVLYVNEGTKGKEESVITQSTSIARYLAREFKLYGKNNEEMAVCDQILDICADMLSTFIKIAFGGDEAEKKKQMDEFEQKTCPKCLTDLENLVKKKVGKDGYAVGYSLTLGDLALLVYIENCNAAESLDSAKYPLLCKNRELVKKHEKLAPYLKNRKQTQF